MQTLKISSGGTEVDYQLTVNTYIQRPQSSSQDANGGATIREMLAVHVTDEAVCLRSKGEPNPADVKWKAP